MPPTPVRRKPGFALVTLLAAAILTSGCGRQFVVLHPAGPVAREELGVIGEAGAAMALVVGCVIALFLVTLIRYRERPGPARAQAPYRPDWDRSPRLEALCFAVPVLIVAFIAVATVRTTFRLDRLPHGRRPLVIDVTSLDWKWLFEYPSQHVATVGYIDVPANRPILFELTADGPMNTFWVPRLGGMEFTMPGRVLPLWLEADRTGVFQGRSANFSGAGFVDMTFRVRALPATGFQRWVARVRRRSPAMSAADYHRLLRLAPAPVQTYSGYPASTFPTLDHGFTLQGGMYMEASLPH